MHKASTHRRNDLCNLLSKEIFFWPISRNCHSAEKRLFVILKGDPLRRISSVGADKPHTYDKAAYSRSSFNGIMLRLQVMGSLVSFRSISTIRISIRDTSSSRYAPTFEELYCTTGISISTSEQPLSTSSCNN